MHILILTRQIGHYHDARYRGASHTFDCVSVVQTASEGGFSEFMATRLGDYNRHALYGSQGDYQQALASGDLPHDLSKIMDQVKPDVVAIAGWANGESAAGIRWAKRNGVPIVIMSESQADDAARSWLRERVKVQIVGMCDAALVGGPPHAAYIKQLGMPEGSIALGYNAVDNDHFLKGAEQARANPDELRKQYGLPARYMLASARFIAKKNLPALVTAHASATQQDETTPDLVILGDGAERPAIEAARAAHVNPEKVTLLGFKGYDDLPALYGLAEAFVHVSTVEQWGLVVNEAMSAGIPVIVSDKCGVARTVVQDAVSGFISKTDADDIAAALMRFNRLNAEQRQQMGRKAAAAIAQWGPARFGQGLRCAAEKAMEAYTPKRNLSIVDRLVLGRLERSLITEVA